MKILSNFSSTFLKYTAALGLDSWKCDRYGMIYLNESSSFLIIMSFTALIPQ
jgi:hypothetical protein